MAKYSAIKAAVNAYIKANGRKEITGSILNAVLTATIDSLGRFYQFAGGALPGDDPGTPDQNVCYLAGEPGVYVHFGGITISDEEVALLFWDGEWRKQSVLYGIQEVYASVDDQVGNPSVDVSYSRGRLVLDFRNLKGETGDPAGFGTIGADVSGGVGNPAVSVETSGDNLAKNIMFHFTHLKGETGITSVVATIDDSSGTPSCRVSLADQQLILAFSGLKGLKGDTGVSADYPITIYNGLDSDATDEALSAAQGKILNGKIGRLSTIVDGQDGDEDVTPTMAQGYYYTVSGSVISVTSSASSWYNGDASTTPPTGGIDVSGYVGKIVKVTATSIGATSSRCCAMLNESGAVVKSWKENKFVEDGSRYSYQAVIPATARRLYISGGASFALESVVILSANVIVGLTEKVDDLEESVDSIGRSLVTMRPIDLSGLSPTSPYINVTENLWKSSTITKSVIVEIKPGGKYRIESNADLPARYALLSSTEKGEVGTIPDYATGETAVHVLPYAGSVATITAPDDAVGLYLLGTLEGSNVMPSALYEVTDKSIALQGEIDAVKRRTFTYALTLGKRIDLRNPSSANFGKVVAATNNDWGVSQLLDCGDSKWLHYFANTLSSSSNYGGWTGACFYDESGNPLTTGYRLITIGDRSYSQWIDQEVPDGAKYFRVCVGASLDGHPTRNVQMFDVRTEDVFGVGDASEFPHQYYGEKVRFDNLYSLTIPAASAYAGQSAAIYGKYLFIVSNHLANVVLFDMEKKVIVYNLAPGFVEDGDWHCNQSSFGIHRYADDDMFPILYVSQRNNDDGRGVIQGYRIVPVLVDGEIVSFTMTLAQTIYLPVMTYDNCLGNPNATFDVERNRMWVYSRNNNAEADNYNKARFTMFAIPDLHANGVIVSEVVLNDGDILDAFGEEWSMYNAQGGTIRNGKLVILQGYPNAGYINCRVIDLYAQKRQVSFFDLLEDGLDKEPEGVFFYDGAIHFTSASKNIYRINLY